MVNLKKLVEEYEILFLVDRSFSMDARDVVVGETAKGGFLGFGAKKTASTVSRWEAAGQEIAAFIKEVEAIDTDGLDVVHFGGKVEAFRNQTSTEIVSMFSRMKPDGSTPLAEGLTLAFTTLAKSPKPKKFIFCHTDGAPNDKRAVRTAIINQANSQQRDDEMTILFVQIGNDPSATAFLRELDDDLKGAKFDIVDAKTADEAKRFGSVAELIAHAIND